MCGILSYYNKNGISAKNLDECLHALKTIKHRGPDGEGVVLINTKNGSYQILKTDETPQNITTNLVVEDYQNISADLFFGHRRLSIIDLSINGHQPMHDASGNWILFNGEIYNYLEIKEELKTIGYNFKTDSDTEVIHKAYLAWGTECLKKFNGMWSIILWDNTKQKIVISNDRFGVKPLYYLQNENELILCSEQKQLHNYQNRIAGLNEETIRTFLELGYLDYDANTMYKNVYRFNPAHYTEINVGSNFKLTDVENQKPYYSLPENINTTITAKEAIEEFRSLLHSAVSLRLRADVPIGFALSGGLDSSATLYTAKNILKDEFLSNFQTFSAIFPNMEGDESKFMKLVQQDAKCKTNYINPLEIFNATNFESHVYHQDAPLQGTSYFAEWCVAKLVKENNTKILLVGQGADEAFAGYHHHFYRYCRQLVLHGKISKYIHLAKQYSEIKNIELKKLHRIIINDIKLIIKLKTHLSNIDSKLERYWNEPVQLQKILQLDFTTYMLPCYLRSDDRDAMAFSIETRHPFLDYRMINFGFSLPDNLKIKDGWQKWIIREAMHELPEAIRFRKDKKGFTTPQKHWEEQHKNLFETYLPYLKNLKFNYTIKDNFRAYGLGAWLKTNNFSN